MNTVLVIEDTQYVREEVTTILELEGFKVIAAANGKKGIELYNQQRPDLILCDIMMPEMDGYEFLEYLKKEEPDFDIPFIFLTAKAARSEQRKGMIEGADDYIVKPFTAEELVQSIRSRLERQNQIKQGLTKELDSIKKILTFTLPTELLVPMNGIIGTANLMTEEDRSFNQDEYKNFARSILLSAENLKRQMNNYLLKAQLMVWEKDEDYCKEMRHQISSVSRDVATQSLLAYSNDFPRVGDLRIRMEESRVAIAEWHLVKIIQELVFEGMEISTPGTEVILSGQKDGSFYNLALKTSWNSLKQVELVDFPLKGRKASVDADLSMGMSLVKKLTEIHSGKFKNTKTLEDQRVVEIALPEVAI